MLISVIVPVYNIKDYLPRCVRSILSQTLQEFELILVDDGSTDGSGEICDAFSGEDERISVCHSVHSGAGASRNRGLDLALGDFIAFVDGDDYVHPQYLEILHDTLAGCDGRVAFVKAASCTVDGKGERSPGRMTLPFATTILCQEECILSLFYIRKGFCSTAVWGKLFRREVLAGLFFENITCEDMEYLSRVYQRIDCAACITAELYYYVRRPGSLTWNELSIRNRDEIGCLLKILDNLSVTQLKGRAYCLEQLYTLIPAIRRYVRRTADEKLTGQICNHAVKVTLRDFIRNKYIPLRKKTGLLVFNTCPSIYDLFVHWRLSR